jgi:hypothetical protein
MKTKLIGDENAVDLTIDGKPARAVRVGGRWHIEPADMAVSRKNDWRNLRDLRSAVRVHNAKN